MGKDYYRILQLTRSAKDSDIKTAYRRLALQCHPIKNVNDPKAENKFLNLAEAYEVLSDHRRRAIYDQFGEQGLKKGVPTGSDHQWSEGYVFHGDANRVFREFFGGDNPFAEFYTNAEQDLSLGFGGLNGRDRAKQDPPLERDLLLSLEDCYYGAIKKMKINRRVLNDDGMTTSIREKILSITVKRGWLPGTRLTFSGEGDQGTNTIPFDIVFIVKDKPHPYFTRENADLILKTKISLGHALTGTAIHLEHLDGRKLDIPVNELVRPGYRKRLSGLGMPLMSDPEKYGDLLIEFDVEYPQMLNAHQKLLIKEALLSNHNGKKPTLEHQQSQNRKSANN